MLTFWQSVGQFTLLIAVGLALRLIGRVDQSHGRVISALIVNLTLPATGLVNLQDVSLEPKDFILPAACLVSAMAMLPVAWVFCRGIQPAPLRQLLICTFPGFSIGQFGLPLMAGKYQRLGVEYALLFDIGNSIVVFVFSYAFLFVMNPSANTRPLHDAESLETLETHDGAPCSFADGFQVAPRNASGSFVDVREHGASASHVSKCVVAGAVCRKLLGSMPLWGYFIGLVLALTGLKIPDTLRIMVFEPLAAANAMLVSVMLGVFLMGTTDFGRIRLIMLVTVCRLVMAVVFAGIAWLCLFSADFHGAFRGTMIGCFFLPPAMVLLPFAVEFGLDGEMATLILSVNSVTAVLSLLLMQMLVTF